MRKWRLILMWIALAAVVRLIDLSVLGAFLGTEAAERLFNTVPQAAYFLFLLAFLAAGLAVFRRLLRRGGLLAMHVGCILILAGGMWGSRTAHGLRRKLYKGYMAIFQGQGSREVTDKSMRKVVGRLDFEVKLEKFWLEYHPAKDKRWLVHGGIMEMDPASGSPQWKTETVQWKVGREAPVPFTDIHMRVLKYLPGASRGDGVKLLIITPDGRRRTIPAEVGREIELQEPKVKLKITRLFSTLRVSIKDGRKELIDEPGPPRNPAIEVEVDSGDGQTSKTYAFLEEMGMHHRVPQGGLTLLYLPPGEPQADPSSSLPAVNLQFRRADRTFGGWVLAREDSPYEQLPLEELYPDRAAWREAGSPSVFFQRPQPPISDYKSELVVLEDGREVARKTIEVNDPLHYGGYHFYQADYDHEAGRYTILSVTSDRGLWAAYAGFALLCAGALWHFWARPVIARMAKGVG